MPFIPKCPPATIAFKSSGLPPPNLQTENTCPSIIIIRDWSKRIGGGWAGAFGNVVDKKHMTHPLLSAQK